MVKRTYGGVYNTHGEAYTRRSVHSERYTRREHIHGGTYARMEYTHSGNIYMVKRT